jgi:hypothetical protein
MSGRASPAAPAAVAVHGAERLPFHDESDHSAEATPAHRSRWIERGPVRHGGSLEARRVGVELREVVTNLVPRSLRRDEDVSDRPRTRVIREVAGRHEHAPLERRVGRNDRAAVAAERARESGRRFPTVHVLGPAQAKAARRACHVGGE